MAQMQANPGSREINVSHAKDIAICLRDRGYEPQDTAFKINDLGIQLATSLEAISGVHRIPTMPYGALTEDEFKTLSRLYTIDPKGTTCPIFSVKFNGKFVGYVMEYIRGCDLLIYTYNDRLSQHPKSVMLDILNQYYDVIENYHANGVAHGDPNIKNIMINTSSVRPRVVMIDPVPISLFNSLHSAIKSDGEIMSNVRCHIELRYQIGSGEFELFRSMAQRGFRLAEPRFESGP